MVLGAASTLPDDVARAGAFHGVIAVNDAAIWWPGPLDAVVSFHPEDWPRRLRDRAAAGYPPPGRVIGWWWPPEEPHPGIERLEWEFPGGSGNGSSSLFATKVALIDLGFDRVTLCGVPLTEEAAHFNDARPFACARSWRTAWRHLAPEWRARVRSMSGWTRDLLEGHETMDRLRNTTGQAISLPSLHVIPAGGELEVDEQVMTYPDNRAPLGTMLKTGDLELLRDVPKAPAKAVAKAPAKAAAPKKAGKAT